MKRPFDRRGRRAFDAREVDVVDRARESEHVHQQDQLVALIGAGSADANQEVDRGRPLLVSRARLAHERVRMSHEARDELVEARIVAAYLREDRSFELLQALDRQRSEWCHRLAISMP